MMLMYTPESSPTFLPRLLRRTNDLNGCPVDAVLNLLADFARSVRRRGLDASFLIEGNLNEPTRAFVINLWQRTLVCGND
jgi:hypothetical protein